jgi:hypothetical protein
MSNFVDLQLNVLAAPGRTQLDRARVAGAIRSADGMVCSAVWRGSEGDWSGRPRDRWPPETDH